MSAISVAASLVWAWEGCGGPWNPGGGWRMAGPPPGPLAQGTLLSTSAMGEDGPMLKLKWQMTSSAWSAAQLSRPARDRWAGTFTPLTASWVGAANTQTAQTMAKPAATKGTMMASPAGIRAR